MKAQAGPSRMVDVSSCESCGQCAFGWVRKQWRRCFVESLADRGGGSRQMSSQLEGEMDGRSLDVRGRI